MVEGETLHGVKCTPPSINLRICFHFYVMLCSSPAKGDTLTQATVSHPTFQLRGHSDPDYSVPPYNQTKGALTQATLSHQAKVYTPTQAAAVKLRGHSNPGYSVPPNSPAKGETLTQATVSPLPYYITELRETL